MAPAGNIRDFFKPVSHPLLNGELPGPSSLQRSSTNPMKEASTHDGTSLASASQRVIRSSDDEESNSDSSLENLSNALQFRKSVHGKELNSNGFKSSASTHTRGRRRLATPPSAVKLAYKFDMKRLVNQAEMYKSADASAQSLQALLDETSKSDSTSPSASSGGTGTGTGILESVVAEQEGVSLDQVLQAVKRTEATQDEKRCYVFELKEKYGRATNMSMLEMKALNGWKQGLTNPCQREHIVLSDFARDMITLGDLLPDELFLCIFDEMCFESRDDLREAYSRILVTSNLQIRRLISQQTFMLIFRRLGVKEFGIDIKQKLDLTSSENNPYEGRDWTNIRSTIKFISKISDHLSPPTCAYVICLLARLCVDTAVLETIGLLSAVQNAIEQASKSFDSNYWGNICREICETTFDAVYQPTLRLQMLRCLPQTTVRTHEIRRRLALAFFFDDNAYLTRAPHLVIDIWEILKQLDGPQFQINRDTDYQQLAALISILDVAIDNGQSNSMSMSLEEEERFNAEVDTLAARIRNIWSSINDAGASFMSRVDAKEVMDCLRHRLLYAIRTKPVPKRSIFDLVPDDREEKLKQSKLMKKYFIKTDPNKG